MGLPVRETMLPNVNLLPTNVVRLPDAQCSMLPTLTQTVQHPSNSTHRISTRTSSSFNSNSNPHNNSNNSLLLPNSSQDSNLLHNSNNSLLLSSNNSLLLSHNSLP